MPTLSGLPRQIRHFVQSQFAELRPECQQIEQETLLIREGHYCGHRYQASGLSAVWFREENELKFYDTDGGILRVVSPQAIVASRRDHQHASDSQREAA